MTMMESAVQAVSTVGFPVVAYLLMFKLAKDTIRENTAALNSLQTELKRLKDEVGE